VRGARKDGEFLIVIACVDSWPGLKGAEAVVDLYGGLGGPIDEAVFFCDLFAGCDQ